MRDIKKILECWYKEGNFFIPQASPTHLQAIAYQAAVAPEIYGVFLTGL